MYKDSPWDSAGRVNLEGGDLKPAKQSAIWCDIKPRVKDGRSQISCVVWASWVAESNPDCNLDLDFVVWLKLLDLVVSASMLGTCCWGMAIASGMAWALLSDSMRWDRSLRAFGKSVTSTWRMAAASDRIATWAGDSESISTLALLRFRTLNFGEPPFLPRLVPWCWIFVRCLIAVWFWIDAVGVKRHDKKEYQKR